MITPEEIKRLFELAKIEVTEEELTRFPKEIDAILEYVRALQSAPLEGIAPTISFAPEDKLLRSDEAALFDEQMIERLRGAFPGSSENFLKVKNVFKTDN